ncbi:MAG: hypothetical protein WC822_01090 [Candidatus Paceibacterota bacterium]|jgi:hypothetical protein
MATATLTKETPIARYGTGIPGLRRLFNEALATVREHRPDFEVDGSCYLGPKDTTQWEGFNKPSVAWRGCFVGVVFMERYLTGTVPEIPGLAEWGPNDEVLVSALREHLGDISKVSYLETGLHGIGDGPNDTEKGYAKRHYRLGWEIFEKHIKPARDAAEEALPVA